MELIVCNDIGEVFQSEIDKVIFSYVDRTERASATNLVELVENRSKSLVIEKNSLIQQIHEINFQIIKLENKRTSTYKKLILDSVEKQKASLQRHEESAFDEKALHYINLKYPVLNNFVHVVWCRAISRSVNFFILFPLFIDTVIIREKLS